MSPWMAKTPPYQNRQKFQEVFSNNSYTKRASSSFSQFHNIIPILSCGNTLYIKKREIHIFDCTGPLKKKHKPMTWRITTRILQ
jgi:hypothetical protein